MSETIRVSGKTVEDAITNATIRLGVSSDNIVVTVIEHESRGFLGIGAKDAVIEVRKKEEADFEAERISKKAAKDAADAAESAREASQQVSFAPEKKEELKQTDSLKSEVIQPEAAKTEAPKAEVPKAEAPKAEAPKTEAPKTEAPKTETPKSQMPKAGISQAEVPEDEADDEYSSGNRHERVIKPLEDPTEAIEKAERFLKDVYSAMNMEAELKSTYDGEILNVQMAGDDMGILIGKRGQTLDSLQYLTSLVVNKGSSSYVRVKLDTENYRERRKATLENLSKNIAVKVKKSRQSVYLEPMNPYERRIIHSALQDDPFVTTHSEGEEPERKVVVTLRKDADLEALERKYGERRSGRGTRGNFHSGRGGHSFDRRGQKRREYGSSAPNTSEDSAGSDTPQSTDE